MHKMEKNCIRQEAVFKHGCLLLINIVELAEAGLGEA